MHTGTPKWIKSQVLYRLSYGLSSPGPYGCVAGKVNIKGEPRHRFPLSRLEQRPN